MDYSYSNGGQFQPRDSPLYQPPVIVVQVPAYTCTSMQQQDYRLQTRNCTKNNSKTLKVMCRNVGMKSWEEHLLRGNQCAPVYHSTT